ncbi:LptF/LptG family permease [Paracoccus cavernae]|uniref:LptF/LptG family permease n=1 Tax=Paracoccus cavernae TaxID=1571207 RepID=A0ABT8D701_9RHOB|nr:LptF/LptG family permease [Paracoccus cavernae]
MARIDRYILSQFLTLFGFFALVLVSVYWINRAVSLFEQLISDGQTAMVVLEFTALTLPLVISVVLPIAAFAASAYGTNRLSSDPSWWQCRPRAFARAAGASGSGLRADRRDDVGGAGSRPCACRARAWPTARPSWPKTLPRNSCARAASSSPPTG